MAKVLPFTTTRARRRPHPVSPFKPGLVANLPAETPESRALADYRSLLRERPVAADVVRNLIANILAEGVR